MAKSMTTSQDISADRPLPARRNVLILASCQALAMTGTTMVVAVGALTGAQLATDKGLATLPVALTFMFMMVATAPASLLMGRLGRRVGFTVGQTVGVVGASVATYAIFRENFLLFCVGSALLGVHNGFWQYLRFAAADTASEAFRSRAISYVMAGGVVAAIVGPELAKFSRAIFAPVLFAGCYVAIGFLCLIAILLLQGLHIPPPKLAGLAGGRPVTAIVRQPVFIVAALAGMFGYSVMTLVMQATPLAMDSAHFHFDDAAFVIQGHVLGMFAPSFVTGHLIRRFGALNVILTGTFLYILCMTINLTGGGLMSFWISLLLLGIGWNFMFVGGTTLLTEAYTPAERAKTQAVNDFCVFGTVAVASYLSGALHHWLGWKAVNLGIALPMLVVFLAATWLLMYRRRARAAA
jgi:MFS family permease